MTETTSAESNELRELARGDAEKAAANNVDLNPFSTVGTRHLWQQGWDGIRPDLLTEGSYNWRAWERGRQARILSEERKLQA